ncbi:NmrA family NAD(P)-binding protein [Selenomonadales bacterium OttesenSCG-928-I06]|nr:NmrA family NAD(P)-binding protein [Selenomonadales bacterium OttesenSCG-928-I06]
MLLVTGANGKVGSRVIAALAAKGFKIKAMDIDPRVERYKEEIGAETFVGDASSAKAMKEAMKGCDQVFYIPPLFSYQETKIAQIAIDAAVEAGVRQFVMLSVINPQMNTMPHHTMKLNAESHLIYQGLVHKFSYTIIQPAYYHHNLVVSRLMEKGKYYHYTAPNIKMAYLSCDDIAEVLAKILSEDSHNFAIYPLCGSDYLTPPEAMELFTKISGKEIALTYVTKENLEENITKYVGNDSYAKETMIRMHDTYAKYGFPGNKNVLEWLLGRPATTLESYFRKELEKEGYAVKG